MPCLLDVVNVVGKKWTFTLLEEINFHGNRRFNSLTKKMSISPKVLADRLKELEQLGIISKKINPLQTNYKLTKKGISLHEILHNLKIWQGAYNNLQCATTLCSECTEIKSMHNKSIDN